MRTFFRCLGCFMVPLCLLILLIAGLVGILVARFDSSSGGNGTIAQNALAMAAHLHNCPPDNLDQCWDADFPQAAIAYWAQECPGCAAASNGDLQCVLFDVAAYGLAGIPLPVISNAIDFWANYQAPGLRAQGWEEIPNGSGFPEPGDIVILSSPYFDGVGHMSIVTAVTPPTHGQAGSLTFAQANGPGAVNTFPLPADLQLTTWTNYRVLGFIRYVHASQQATPAALTIHSSSFLYLWKEGFSMLFLQLATLAMTFPALTTITNNISDFVKALGVGMFIAVLGIVALISMTSFGNERRVMLAKSAFVMAFVGLGLIIAAATAQTIITNIFGG
jgi:hypothetical protein